jgi:hypothetical protein
MINITNEHIKRLKIIKQKYLGKTSVPKLNNWKSWSNNDIWLHVISQIISVGNAKPAEKFNESPMLIKLVSYNRILKIKNNKRQLERNINYVLREVGAKWVSKSLKKCRKTQAIVHNFKILSSHKNGPKGLLKRIYNLKGLNADKRRVKYLMSIFKFIKSKGSRDFLMELGLVKDAIALDVRVQKTLKKIGIKLPKGFENNPKLYDKIETELLLKLCKPLKLSGIQLDRMIFQNYDKIMDMKN